MGEPDTTSFDFTLADEDLPVFGIEEAAHDGAMAGAYYMTLRDQGVPRKDARRLTLEWMDLRAESQDDGR